MSPLKSMSDLGVEPWGSQDAGTYVLPVRKTSAKSALREKLASISYTVGSGRISIRASVIMFGAGVDL